MGRDGKGSVGFIGIGTMGQEMVRNLLRAGHAVRAFDLAETAVADVVKDGAACAEPGGCGAGRRHRHHHAARIRRMSKR